MLSYRSHLRSLRTILTLPFIVVIITLVSLIGFLSYQTGSKTVHTVSDSMLQEVVGRISQAIDMHVVGSKPVLEAAFPEGLLANDDISDDLDALRSRFWIATSLHTDPNNYVYYGNEAGQSFSLLRTSRTSAEIKYKLEEDAYRERYDFYGINGDLNFRDTENKFFDPRSRPWYQRAADTSSDIWTSVYIDFNTDELVATRARRVLNQNKEFTGVIATDMSLESLNGFVRNLQLSENGMAMILEPDGNLIASSASENVKKFADNHSERIHASESESQYVVDVYEAINQGGKVSANVLQGNVETFVFQDSRNRQIHTAWRIVSDNAGLRWLVAVAMPSSDFMGDVYANVFRTIVAGVIAVLLALIIGLMILNWVSRDMRRLSEAAKSIGFGRYDTPININRSDEIGELASQFRQMQYRLRTDTLTGLYTRDAFEKVVNQRIERYQGSEEQNSFTIMFLDVNNFKNVNDKLGHQIGDMIIMHIATCLTEITEQNDIVARYAGDEFVLLIDHKDSNRQLSHIIRETEQILNPDNENKSSQSQQILRNVQLGLAIGIAHYPEDGHNATSLLSIADMNMYKDKERQKKTDNDEHSE